MLKKLLKYEIPALGRKLGPLYIAWAAASILLGLTLRNITKEPGILVFTTVAIYVMVVTAVFVMSVILIIQRYRNSLLGDEAYFNLALPVSATAHIANKTVSATLWIVLSGFAAILSMLLIGVFGGGLELIMQVEWSALMHRLFEETTWREWLILPELIICLLFSLVKSVLAIYAAMTVGHQVKQHTTLASIGVYIGFMVMESVIGNYVTVHGMIGVLDMANLAGLSGNWFPGVQLGIAVMVLVLTGLSALYFYICRHLIENRLNLN